MKFGNWLSKKFLEWQLSQGERKTITQFAEYLGVPQPSLSEWMASKYIPRGQSLAKLAEKLGYEVYEILGVSRPIPVKITPHLFDLICAVDQLPEGVQVRMASEITRVVPLVIGKNMTDEDKIWRILIDSLNQTADTSFHP